jgi:transposase
VLAKEKTVIGRLWAYVRDDRPVGGLFFYSRNRRGEHPHRHLAGHAVILQADAYAGLVISMTHSATWPDHRGRVLAPQPPQILRVAQGATRRVRRIDAIFAMERESVAPQAEANKSLAM